MGRAGEGRLPLSPRTEKYVLAFCPLRHLPRSSANAGSPRGGAKRLLRRNSQVSREIFGFRAGIFSAGLVD